jgi:hypothetical protein
MALGTGARRKAPAAREGAGNTALAYRNPRAERTKEARSAQGRGVVQESLLLASSSGSLLEPIPSAHVETGFPFDLVVNPLQGDAFLDNARAEDTLPP